MQMNNCRYNVNRRTDSRPSYNSDSANYSKYISSMCNGDSFEDMSKCDLFEHLQFVSFAIDDLRLFLDTHPCDREALDFISELMKIRHIIKKVYTKKYGPIYSYNVDTDNGWSWNEGPMPWSKGGK